jgi:hypothetical protein
MTWADFPPHLAAAVLTALLVPVLAYALIAWAFRATDTDGGSADE